MSDSFSSDFILLTDKLKEYRKISFTAIARLSGIGETRMKNIRRKNSSANLEDLEKLLSNFPELKGVDFQNKDRFQNKTSSSDDDLSDEEMKQRIAELEKENNKLIDEIAAKMDAIDFEKESNKTLSRTVNRLLDLLEKNEKEGLTDEEMYAMKKEIEAFKRRK